MVKNNFLLFVLQCVLPVFFSASVNTAALLWFAHVFYVVLRQFAFVVPVGFIVAYL